MQQSAWVKNRFKNIRVTEQRDRVILISVPRLYITD